VLEGRSIARNVRRNALWLSGASHPHIWKNKIKKVKKSIFFEIKDDHVLYLYKNISLGNYFHCILGKKTRNAP
jgi:hypothetical protein